jgi:hypothetical protein
MAHDHSSCCGPRWHCQSSVFCFGGSWQIDKTIFRRLYVNGRALQERIRPLRRAASRILKKHDSERGAHLFVPVKIILLPGVCESFTRILPRRLQILLRASPTFSSHLARRPARRSPHPHALPPTRQPRARHHVPPPRRLCVHHARHQPPLRLADMTLVRGCGGRARRVGVRAGAVPAALPLRRPRRPRGPLPLAAAGRGDGLRPRHRRIRHRAEELHGGGGPVGVGAVLGHVVRCHGVRAVGAGACAGRVSSVRFKHRAELRRIPLLFWSGNTSLPALETCRDADFAQDTDGQPRPPVPHVAPPVILDRLLPTPRRRSPAPNATPPVGLLLPERCCPARRPRRQLPKIEDTGRREGSQRRAARPPLTSFPGSVTEAAGD